MSVLRSIRHDLPASIVVFLIAIPLSLGIAAASGAPLLAGLVAAVVGGIVAGAVGGAPLQVSGPAAGLTVIVAGTIAEFGFAGTAAIVALAGLVQIVLGASRLGRAALALSPAVVHGMLAGIGLTIALGQIHVVLGGKAQSSAWENVRALPAQIAGNHTASVALGLLTIALLLLWPRIVKTSLLPAALVAVVATTVVAAAVGADVARVDLPSAPLSELTFPSWPDAPAHEILIAVLTIALVASVESLLSAVAVDRLHGGPRANLDRELIGQGAANTVSGLLGGLPVTGVIVRSSTNVAAGACTRASAILHGVWIALFVLLGAALLEKIPMAALAGVLVVVGLRLISVAEIKTYARHRELPAYLVTALGVVATDLLTGVALGLATALALMLWRLARCEVTAAATADGRWRVTITGTLAFVCAGRVTRGLATVPAGADVLVELHLDFLDHGAFAALRDWQESHVRTGGSVTVREMHESWFDRAQTGRLGDVRSMPTRPGFWSPWHSWSDWQTLEPEPASPIPSPATTPDSGSGSGFGLGEASAGLASGGPAGTHPSPDKSGKSDWVALDVQRRDAMAAGIREFERHVAPLVRPQLAGLARDGQAPEQLFITCADSRVVPNLITASGPGDLFCLRNIGNIVPPAGSGDDSVGAAIEYAVTVLGIRTITVCGHTECGAVNAMRTGAAEPGTALAGWLAGSGVTFADPSDPSRCVTENVARQLENLRTYPAVRQALAEGRLSLRGLRFDLSEARMDEVAERMADHQH